MPKIVTDFSNFINKQIALKTGSKQILKTVFLGERKFYCASVVEIFRTTLYGGEEASLGAFLFLLNEDDIVWDIGASIGLFSIYAAPKVKKVISFEPEPQIFQRFQENIALNELEDKIESFPYAIGEADGKMTLNSDGIHGMSPSLSDLNRHSKTVEVKVKSVDALIEEQLVKPTVVKIDIEGAETLALKGAKKLLSSPDRPRMLFVEVHPNFLPAFQSSPQEIRQLVERYGYKILATQARDKQFHIIALRFD